MLFTAIIEFLKKYETFMLFSEQDISFFNYSTAVAKDTDSYDFLFFKSQFFGPIREICENTIDVPVV